MERELLVTGIGGQGVQLAASVLAHAAVAEGRTVQVFGSYGGMMRGGNTEATVVVADGPVQSPPTVNAAWSAILMHHEFSAPALSCLGPRSVALINSTVFEAAMFEAAVYEGGGGRPGAVVEVPAAAMALDLGNIMVASMVMVGAYAAVTGIVGMPALLGAARQALPAYRSQHVELNARALEAGYHAVPHDIAPAWTADPVAAP